jgi:hypothetical protein
MNYVKVNGCIWCALTLGATTERIDSPAACSELSRCGSRGHHPAAARATAPASALRIGRTNTATPAPRRCQHRSELRKIPNLYMVKASPHINYPNVVSRILRLLRRYKWLVHHPLHIEWVEGVGFKALLSIHNGIPAPAMISVYSANHLYGETQSKSLQNVGRRFSQR